MTKGVDVKKIIQRNAGVLAQMTLLAIILLGTILVLISSLSSPPPTLPQAGENLSAFQIGNFSGNATQKPRAEPLNCTPLFNLSPMFSYTYRVSMNSQYGGAQEALTSYEYLGTELVDGTDTHKIEISTNASVQGQSARMSSLMWLEKSTLKCKKLQISMSVMGGQPFTTEAECEEVEGIPGVMCKETLAGAAQIGREEVRVPAGVFNTTIYSVPEEASTLWIAEGVPVPVKIVSTAEGGGGSMELISFKTG
ncbi:MAG: hypothetical protein AB1468_03385 [Candidatus Micrarchaeota archaeon]